MKKPKAIFVFVGKGSFVRKDIIIFSDFFSLKEYNFSLGKKWKTPFQLIHQFFYLAKNVPSTSVIIIQLSGFHAFLPVLFAKIFRKKSVIIAAGTDCHSFPSIGYGNYQRKLLAIFTRISFRLCTHISPKHESLWLCDYTYDNKDYPKQGLKYFTPGITKPYTVIENGFDDTIFKPGPTRNSGTFLAVAGGMEFRFQKELKGIDLILSVAKHFPENKFTIVGIDSGTRKMDAGENVNFLPAVSNDKLQVIYASHQYFFQLSMAEGFPNSLCEAMLCGCTPIGSNVFSIPEIIGTTGYILKQRNVGQLKLLLEKALSENKPDSGKNARERIRENYSLEKRKEKFKRLFQNLDIIREK